jgi:hypothetical protein
MKISVKGERACLLTPEGRELSMSVTDLVEEAAGRRDLCGVRPRGVRLVDSAGNLTVWVHEVSPGVRQLKWIAEDSPAPFGPGAKYRTVRIGLPYLVIFAVFEDGVLTDRNECFFRVSPLEDERDGLFYPALLNCSRFSPPEGRPLSWICTQKIDRGPILAESDRRARMRKGLDVLCRCLLDTGFNYSSELNEGMSWFTESRRVDPRISTIESWQAATEKDQLFVLQVPWIDAGKTVGQVIARIFANGRAGRASLNGADLARIIINHGGRS